MHRFRSILDRRKFASFSTTHFLRQKQFHSESSFVNSIFSGLQRKNPEKYFFMPVEVNNNNINNKNNNNNGLRVEEVIRGSTGNANEELVQLLRKISSVENGDEDLVEVQCLDRFHDWIGVSKLSVAFHLLRRGQKTGERFLARLVRHLGQNSERLSQEEIVAMMLLMYFRGRPWSFEDEVAAFLDVSWLQVTLGKSLAAGSMSNAEIAAVCLGMKKVDGLTAFNPDFRYHLYEAVYDIGQSTGRLTELDNMTVVQILTLLTRGPHLTSDDPKMVSLTLNAFADRVTDLTFGLSTATAIKLCTFGATINVEAPKLTEKVTLRAVEDIGVISPRDIANLVNYLTRTRFDLSAYSVLIDGIADKFDGSGDANLKMADLAALLQSLAALSNVSVFHPRMTRKIFDCVNSVSVERNLLDEDAVMKKLSEVILGRTPDEPADFKRISRFLIELNTNLAFDRRSESGLDPRIARQLVRNVRIPIPQEAFIPQMRINPKTVMPRMRNLVNFKRKLDKYFESEGYCALVHLLPHFPEPDLVFGHIAGQKIRVPRQLKDEPESPEEPVRAPEIGEWLVLNSDRGTKGVNQLNKKKCLEQLGFTLIDLTLVDGWGKGDQMSIAMDKILAGKDLATIYDSNAAYRHARKTSFRQNKDDPVFK